MQRHTYIYTDKRLYSYVYMYVIVLTCVNTKYIHYNFHNSIATKAYRFNGTSSLINFIIININDTVY